MSKKLVLLLLVLAVGGVSAGCNSLGSWFNSDTVVNQGPAVLRDSTAIFTQVALVKKQASVEEAQYIKKHIEDAEKLFLQGTPPATALDELAMYLNTKITNAFVRSAIQQGVLLLRNQVQLPTDIISPKAMVWVKAVLDGGKMGCAAYIAGRAVSSSGVRIAAPDRIDFRATTPRIPNDGWIDFRR